MQNQHSSQAVIQAASTPLAHISGLKQTEVATRRLHGEVNVAPIRTSRSYGQILRENVFTFINNALFGLGIALIVLGRISDALLAVGVALMNVLVSVVQEMRAKRTLDHIALITRPTASVIREGVEQHIDPAEIVLGDVLVARPGDQIVVDGPVLVGQMNVDESLLTGESAAISKHAGDVIYSGSLCMAGSACYQAEQIGVHSLAQQLTTGARSFRRIYTPLQQEVNLVIRILLLLTIFFELLLVINAVVNRIPVVEGVRMSVVIAGLVPIGLFLAIATSYAMGALRIVRQGALVQQANAIESLSHVDVLCLDKTGTLTANALNLRQLVPIGISADRLSSTMGDYAASVSVGNRTSAALLASCQGKPRSTSEEVLFSSALKWSALSFHDADLQGTYVLGAPEIFQPFLQVEPSVEARMQTWENDGLRVLFFVTCPEPCALHNEQGEPQLPDHLTLLGLICLSDALRPEARETLRGFQEMGIQLKLISGDHPQTVAALAKQAGLDTNAQVVSGLELDQLDETAFAQVAEEATIFGRITPQQKKRLVRALRNRGHYVAMIGDGVNDVLSLKQANLGIAMHSGSQATRSVADLVLLDDSFAALPVAFREGQRITNGMEHILKLFLTHELTTVLLLIATGFIGGFPFTPKNGSLLSFFTLGLPTLALAAWAQPGTRPGRSLIRSLLHFVLPASMTMTVWALGLYLIYFIPAYQELLQTSATLARMIALPGAQADAQSALTTFTVLSGLLLIVFVQPPTGLFEGGASRDADKRPALLALVLALGYVGVIALPPLRRFFELESLGLLDYLLLGGFVTLWGICVRFVWRKHLLERFFNVD